MIAGDWRLVRQLARSATPQGASTNSAWAGLRGRSCVGCWYDANAGEDDRSAPAR